MSTAVRIANAPVSYGVFELTADRDGQLPAAGQLLASVADAGYEGIDLGPVGFLGSAADIAGRLREHGLGLAGGWIPLHLATGESFADELAALDRTLDVFEAAAGVSAPPPKPTLADAGSRERRRNPGRGGELPSIRLDDAGWRRLAGRVDEAAGRCRDRGLEPTFHHHACTYVEAPVEVERFLAVTDVDLCLDTGHFALGGGDPLRALRAWADRINHLHVKDVDTGVVEQVVAEQAGMEAVWRRGAFCELGGGDAAVDDFLAAVEESRYRGWMVVEQDRIPAPGEGLEVADRAQRANRDFLRRRGW